MRTLTYTSKDKQRSLTVRERTGRDSFTQRYINASLANPMAALAGVEKINDISHEVWAQIIEVGTYIQQIISLEGEWGNITLPVSESDADRHAFFCVLMDSPERYIETIQGALQEVNTSPLNPPMPVKLD